jgi:2,4-dienoyl-CoA reductase-like NADH-dependent reductase (Old Yellow Enzyme family)
LGIAGENRARLLLDVVRVIREAVSSSFAVAVKLNSADFQRAQRRALGRYRAWLETRA